MDTVSFEPQETQAAHEPAHVDPRAPRFGQTLTASALALGIVTGEAAVVAAVAVVLGLAVASNWRVDAWGFLWKHGARRVVGPPTGREPAAPHRFAKLLGAAGTAAATLLLFAGFPSAGFGVAGVVALLAGFAAITDICVGCRLYRQVAFFRRLNVL